MIDLSVLATSPIQIAAHRAGSSWAWYIIRGAGFASAGLIILLMFSGIGQKTGFIYRFIEPLKAWALHKALAIALCFSIAVHAGFLLVDHYVKFTPIQLFVPFLSHYNNKTSLMGIALGWAAVALGILATYGVAIIVASSLGWIDSRKGLWRRLHYLSYVVVLFVFVHALYAGSDLEYGGFRMIWILIGLTIVAASLLRLLRLGRLKS